MEDFKRDEIIQNISTISDVETDELAELFNGFTDQEVFELGHAPENLQGCDALFQKIGQLKKVQEEHNLAKVFHGQRMEKLDGQIKFLEKRIIGYATVNEVKSGNSVFGKCQLRVSKEHWCYPNTKSLIFWAEENKYNDMVGESITKTFSKTKLKDHIKNGGDMPEGVDIIENHVTATVQTF